MYYQVRLMIVETKPETDHEQLGDGEAHGRAEQDKVGARGDDGAEDGAGGDDAARAAGLIPSLRHHGQEQAAEGSGFAHGTAHQTRENHAGHDGGIAEARDAAMSCCASLTTRFDRPPSVMISPANTKKGMAIKG